ncbi:peptide chain release factor N(5)-glutamine methyltransferase [Malassezia sp. CBS 17886]|nr:peptide chain release factor N(5)-glutamine methyltransferase [Malassezia sp. CBS 17886]
MIPTPEVGHLRRAEYAGAVYDPAEDTFALIDALEMDAAALVALGPVLCVEIGAGSGCVSAFLARIAGASSAAYICTDISRAAAQCTAETGCRNGVLLSPVLTSTLDALLPRAAGAIDVLLFNPPYVVTSDEEERQEQAAAALGGALAGGSMGTRLIDVMIEARVPYRALRPGGRFYLVAIHRNEPDVLVRRLQGCGMETEIILKRRANRELLYIIRAVKPRGVEGTEVVL